MKACIEQAKKLTLTSRAFHNNLLARYEKLVAETFKYDMVIFMNSGVEAVCTAIKMARRWGYDKKKIAPNKA